MPLQSLIKSAWNYFLDGFACLILPEIEICEYGNDSGDCNCDPNREDEIFKLWDDIGGEG